MKPVLFIIHVRDREAGVTFEDRAYSRAEFLRLIDYYREHSETYEITGVRF